MFKLVAVCFLLAVFVAHTEACPGLFGMMGGGCGCGAPPPPPPCGGGCGGGCGRKKREVLAPQIRTRNSDPCPQAEWKTVMEKALKRDAASSAHAVQSALASRFEARFFVTCVETPSANDLQAVFVSSGEGFCSHGAGPVWCEAIALLG